jgi:hypothetical protein
MKSRAFAKQPSDALFDLPCACQNLRRLTRVVTRIYDQELRSGLGFPGTAFIPLLVVLRFLGCPGKRFLQQKLYLLIQ